MGAGLLVGVLDAELQRILKLFQLNLEKLWQVWQQSHFLTLAHPQAGVEFAGIHNLFQLVLQHNDLIVHFLNALHHVTPLPLTADAALDAHSLLNPLPQLRVDESMHTIFDDGARAQGCLLEGALALDDGLYIFILLKAHLLLHEVMYFFYQVLYLLISWLVLGSAPSRSGRRWRRH